MSLNYFKAGIILAGALGVIALSSGSGKKFSRFTKKLFSRKKIDSGIEPSKMNFC